MIITITLLVAATLFFVMHMTTNKSFFMILSYVCILSGCGINVVLGFLKYRSVKKNTNNDEK